MESLVMVLTEGNLRGRLTGPFIELKKMMGPKAFGPVNKCPSRGLAGATVRTFQALHPRGHGLHFRQVQSTVGNSYHLVSTSHLYSESSPACKRPGCAARAGLAIRRSFRLILQRMAKSRSRQVAQYESPRDLDQQKHHPSPRAVFLPGRGKRQASILRAPNSSRLQSAVQPLTVAVDNSPEADTLQLALPALPGSLP